MKTQQTTFSVLCLMHATILLLALFLAGCQEDDTLRSSASTGKAIVLTGEIDQVNVTRVNDSGFCDGDMMGVYIVDYAGNTPGKLALSGNRASNARFTFDEAAYQWNSAYDIYWKDDKTNIDVYGYYPFSSPSSIESYPFEVQKDQSKSAGEGQLGGYEASDFLWAKATDVSPTTTVIRLAFKHEMSTARVTLVEGTGFTTGEWTGLTKQVLVLNTKRNALINLSDGTVTPTGEVATTGIIPSVVNDEFRGIVVPQPIAAGTPLFSMTVGNVSYKFTKTEAFTYISGKMHNFAITVNKKTAAGDYEFVLTGESITKWETDQVSHEATAREYIVIDVPEAGTLEACIAAENKDYKKLKNLKLTGEINAVDFGFMKDKLESLESLNMKEVVIRGGTYDYRTSNDDEIPFGAFHQKITLLRVILPDKLTAIGGWAFLECKSLVGSLVIPDGVKVIGDAAFKDCSKLNGSLILPGSLEEIGVTAFYSCGFVCELKLPEQLKHIRYGAFYGCSGFYSNLTLPSELESLEQLAFASCSNLTGSLTIPQKITEVAPWAFRSTGFNGNLILHDGITSIGEYAFSYTPLIGELNLPQNLTIIGDFAFYYCDFSGELKLPNSLLAIGNATFSSNQRLMGKLEIPENVLSIGSSAFYYCTNLEGVILPRGLENIQGNAFGHCYSIGSIVCKAEIPPYLLPRVFDGVAKDNFTLEVPETAVQQYQTASGWSEFKRISAHRELVCRPQIANAINTRCVRDLVLNAEGDWEVESIPYWCTLSAMSGSKKTELTLTINAMTKGSATRTEDIVFKLKDKDYTTRCAVSQYNYEYEEDEIITLQQASKGKGVNLVFIGDGFNAEDISKGEYLKAMKQQVEYFFGLEPYTTYRDYFNVYTAIALSQESGIGTVNTIRYTKFETSFTSGAGLKGASDAIFEYALRMPTVNLNNLNQSLIVLTPNTTDYGGICQMWTDGSAIAFCPMSTYGYPFDTRGLVQHEAGGHGFGKLGDEYIYHNAFIDACTCSCCSHDGELRSYQGLGWLQNLSLTGKMHEVPWSHLIFHARYSSIVDIFEGGYGHTRGVFRSEQSSCMNNNIPYYSTISREAIVKRIMDYAGEPYTFEKFLANDKTDAGAVTRSQDNQYWGPNPYGKQSYPQIHKGSPAVRK